MNEIIDLILHFVAIFICTLFYDLFYSEISGLKLKINFKNFLVIIGTTGLIFLNNLNDSLAIKAICNLLIISLNYKLVFHDELKKIFIIYLIVYGLNIFFELVCTIIVPLTGLLSFSLEYLNYTKLILSIIICGTEYLFLALPIIKKLFNKLIKKIILITTLMNVLYLLLIVIITIGIFNIYNYETHGSFKIVIIIVLLFAVLFVFLITSIMNSHILKLTNKKLINYNDNYSRFLDEYKIYKHNINHKLLAMKAYGNKKINSLIDDLLEEENYFTLKNNNLYNVSEGIKGIVAEKLYYINFNVIVNNKIEGDPFSYLSPKAFNSVSESIGICLDNAIEAAEKTDNPIILLDLYEDKQNIFIKIGNNFNNLIDLEKLGDKYYSTKKRESGLGLFSIKRNNQIKESINIVNDFYYIELKIKKAR